MRRFFSSIRGDAIVECAIVLPIWILVNYMAYEGLRMYTTYRALTVSLREAMVSAGVSARSQGNQGTMFALPTPNGGSVTFAKGVSVTSAGNSYNSCVAMIAGSSLTQAVTTYTDNNCPALLIAERARMILDAAKFNIEDNGQGVDITVAVSGSPLVTTITVSGRYKPSLNLLRGLLPIDATARGPWSVS